MVQHQDLVSLTTLAAVTAITGALTSGVSDDVRLSSVETSFQWDDAKGTGGGENEDGPLIVGLAHGDYTTTEIEEYMKALSAVDFGDKIAAERSRRLIRVCGVLSAMRPYLLMKKYKLNWTLSEGIGVNAFAYNASSGTALTTGSILSIVGHANMFLK